MKRFLEWIGLKIRLDSHYTKPPPVHEGDIWWSSLGENVGHEIAGKGKSFTRAVIIYKKISYDFYLVIPTSTKIHRGKWYIPYYENDSKEVVACLHQIRTIDYRRLREKIGFLREREKNKIWTAFKKLYL